MKSVKYVLPVSSLMLAVAASMVASDAQAITKIRVLGANATSYCQTSLPVFDGQVRKRPLAVQNEGDANAFVTCSFAGQLEAGAATTINVYAHNGGASPQDLSCTLVTGYATSLTNQYVVKSVTVQPGGMQAAKLSWVATDFAGDEFPDANYNLLCNLLPGVGLDDSYVHITEDVGA